jgi:hypothetical protein
MAALVSALDNTPQQIGENGHVEYGWSNSIQEKILQLSFQITRTNLDGVEKLRNILKNMLSLLHEQVKNGTLPEKQVAKGYLSILYKMIAQTRDIIDGKGECMLTYMMIYTWYEFFPQLAKFALECLVDLDNEHPFGSWKDIKYFCQYCKDSGLKSTHELIKHAIYLLNKQVRKDFENFSNNSNKISLAAKWAPREKSKFCWIYSDVACDYFPQYMETANTAERQVKATLKCRTEYRKILSTLNKAIDTLQIKQCGKMWSSIDFNKVTSISLSKQRKAFLNVKKNGEKRFDDNEDRVECAENFTNHIQRAVRGEVEMKGKRISMADFTKQATQLLNSTNNQTEKDLLNSQWRDSSSLTGALGNMIPMVDLSVSMEGDPMEVAIALGIRIAEKSKLGKRVMTFSLNPKWINLESYNDFVSQVRVIKGGEVGYNTDFYKALDLILTAIVSSKMSPEDVQDMILVMLSDMQIDSAENIPSSQKKVLMEQIEQKYAETGMRVHGVPFKPPHILFWNLRSTSGFPSLSNQQGASMMSGFSPSLLNEFCDKGLDALLSCTPWSVLESSLNKERYQILSDKLDMEIIV